MRVENESAPIPPPLWTAETKYVFLPWQKCIQTIQKKHKIVLGPEYQLWDLIIIIQMDLFNWDVINDRSIIIYLFPS